MSVIYSIMMIVLFILLSDPAFDETDCRDNSILITLSMRPRKRKTTHRPRERRNAEALRIVLISTRIICRRRDLMILLEKRTTMVLR